MTDHSDVHGRRVTLPSAAAESDMCKNHAKPRRDDCPVDKSHVVTDPYFRSLVEWTPPKNATVSLPDGEEAYRPPPTAHASTTMQTLPFTPAIPIQRASDAVCSQSAPSTKSACLEEFSRGVHPPPNVIAPASSPPEDDGLSSLMMHGRCDSMHTPTSGGDYHRRSKVSHLGAWLTGGGNGSGADVRPLLQSSSPSVVVSRHQRCDPCGGGGEENSAISTNLHSETQSDAFSVGSSSSCNNVTTAAVYCGAAKVQQAPPS